MARPLRRCNLHRSLTTFLVPLIALALATQALAGPAGLGNVTGVSSDGASVTLGIGADQLSVRICGPGIVRIDYRRNGQTDPDTPVIDPKRVWPGDPAATINTSGSPIVLKTARLVVQIDKAPCRLALLDAQGQRLLGEQPLGGVFVDAPSDANGGLRFTHLPGQNFYGIKAYDSSTDNKGLLRNGDNTPGRTYQANASLQGGAGAPFVWTSAGYGLLVDADNGYVVVDDTRLEFYYGSPPATANGRRYEKKNSVQYYLFVGEPKELLAAAAQVTGRMPMFPRWAMGFTNSQWGIDEAELFTIVDLYRAKDIPLDNYTFDFDWKAWGEDDYGEFRWNKDKFPSALQADPSGSVLRAKMDAQGVKLTGIMKPRIVRCTKENQDSPLTAQAQQAQDKGYWYPGLEKHFDYFLSRFLHRNLFIGELDFANPQCRSWYWDSVKSHGAMDKGLVGFWNDEADAADVNGQQVLFHNFEHFHMQQALYEGQRADPAAPRAWSLNRNFYLGAQRHAYGMWSGDIHADFYTMERQSERLLTVVALGQAKWGMDTGGFAGNPTPENYARWLQFSAFVPVFRVHGEYNKHRQPWVYGATAEEVAKNAVHLRYHLAPYVYAYERAAYESGVGLVRPLMVDFPRDPGSANQSHEWMFGEWLLVAPVLQGQHTLSAGPSLAQPVYLPPGTWIDYFRGDVLPGGRTVQYPINAGVWTDIPLFIRKGAIIPTHDVVRALGEAKPELVYLDIFPDKQESTTTLYDDDGATYGYEGDAYFKQRITAKDESSALTLSIAAKAGGYEPTVKYYLARLHGRAATAVTLNEQALAKVPGLTELRAAPSGWTSGRDVYGPVTFVKVPAGKDAEQRVRITGTEAVLPANERFEAEEASLSGPAPQLRAKVNTNHAGFTGTGFVDGLEQPDTAVTFSVKTRTAGTYPITLRAANGAVVARTLSVYVNGERRGPVTVPPQPNWDTWADVAVPLELAAGNNIITWRYDPGDTGGVNLDAMTVPFFPAAAVYEAESAELTGGAGVNIDHRHYTGTGFVDKFTSPGAAVTFTVAVAADGDYKLTTRYANGTGGDRSASLYVNGTRLKAVTLPATQDWETWGDESETVKLKAGTNTVRMAYDPSDTANVNLDRITVIPVNGTVPDVRPNLVDNGGFEAGTAGWSESHTVGPLSFGVDAGDALDVPEYARFGDKRAYFYCPGAYAQQISQRVAVPAGGQTHRFEAWVRCANTNPTDARAVVSGYGGEPKVVVLPPSDGKWRLVTIEHVPVTADHADISFTVNSPGGTTVQIDEVRFIRE